VAILALGLLRGLSDLWWPATVLSFGPRWVLILPLFLLIPAAWLWDRALLPVLGVGGLLLLGPVLDFRIGWRSLLPDAGRGPDLRVLSLNAAGGSGLTPAVASLLSDPELDLLAIQECGNLLRGDPELLPDWHIDRRSGVCLLSRFEIREVAEMEREVLESAGGSGVAVTYTLDVDGIPVYLTNVHLETPRAGFELFRSWRFREGIPKIQEKSFLRGVEIRKARAWVDAFSGPHLVVGDFNTPPESRLYREAWEDWQNAFSLTGWGVGGTRLNGWIRVRIDHVLASQEWRVRGAWLGEDVGSDHLPIGADLEIR
jgi:endonuclease/exonuclease/phosphatase (EEP) superfamily protein YafD